MTTEKELLTQAISEIKGLRKRNELMSARLDMFDSVMSALHGQPATNRGGAMHPDIVFQIEMFLSDDDNSKESKQS